MSSPKIIKASKMESRTFLVGVEGEEPNSDPQDPLQRREAILDRARAEATSLLEAAQAEVEERRLQAQHEGYQEGLRIAQEETREALEEIRTLARQARLDRESILRDSEQQVVELALAVARSVIHRELTADPSLVTAAVKEAMSRIPAADWIRLRLCPADLERVSAYWAEARAKDPGLDHVILVADAEVEPGGCLIDTVVGTLDVQPDTKLLEIGRAFSEAQGEPS